MCKAPAGSSASPHERARGFDGASDVAARADTAACCRCRHHPLCRPLFAPLRRPLTSGVCACPFPARKRRRDRLPPHGWHVTAGLRRLPTGSSAASRAPRWPSSRPHRWGAATARRWRAAHALVARRACRLAPPGAALRASAPRRLATATPTGRPRRRGRRPPGQAPATRQRLLRMTRPAGRGRQRQRRQNLRWTRRLTMGATPPSTFCAPRATTGTGRAGGCIM